MKSVNFTIYDVREINQSRIDKKTKNLNELTSISQKFIRDTKFTTQDINSAFAEAIKSVEKEIR